MQPVTLILFMCVCVELELEKAENFLENRLNRKREYRAKTLELAEIRRRKWLVQKGKKDMLDF